MSDHPHDEDELQALLAGRSALSRRYRELSDEQPPAQVDAAILASSRWAVGADSRRTDSRHSDSRWPRFSFMRWSVPLATAAVVVIAATLILTIERDPEIDRLYDEYDKPPRDMREKSKVAATSKSDIASSEVPAPANAPASPNVPAPAGASAPLRAPASLSTLATENAAQKNEQRRIAARKRNVQIQQELAANRSVKRDSSVLVAAEIEADVIDEQKLIGKERVTGQEQLVVEERVVESELPAEPFPGSDDVLADIETADVDDVADARADTSGDEFAVAGASTESDSLDTIETEELMKSGVEPLPGRQQPSILPADGDLVVAQRFADQDSPSQFAEAQAMREPETWIQDIEKLLADGKRAEAIASLEKFRLDYPDYQLPEVLQSLVPAQTE